MKHIRKIIGGSLVVVILAVTIMTAFAATAYSARNGAGMTEENKLEMFEMKKNVLKAKVESGAITQDEADAILKSIEANLAACDGTGSAGIGKGLGARFGENGAGRGQGGTNPGAGMGRGMGKGLCSNKGARGFR